MPTKLLPVRLSETELAAKGHHAGDLIRQMSEAETAKKDATRRYNDEIESLKQSLALIGEELRSGSEYREVEIDDYRNEERRTIDTVRLDTGEVVASRGMSPDELTRPLPFPTEVKEAR